MNDQEFEQLQARADALYAEYKALQGPADAKGREWSSAVDKLKTETIRRQIYYEVMAERRVAS